MTDFNDYYYKFWHNIISCISHQQGIKQIIRPWKSSEVEDEINHSEINQNYQTKTDLVFIVKFEIISLMFFLLKV